MSINPVNWDSISFTGVSGTTTDGVTFTGSAFNKPSSYNSEDYLTGSDFAGYELSNVEALSYNMNDDWSFNLSSQADTLLYADFWRGGASYTFNQGFDIVSGFAGATVNGNTLTLSGRFDNYYSGVLDFGSINSLSVDSSSISTSGIGMTFATVSDDKAEPVPEPLTIFGTVTALGFGSWFKKQRKQKN